MEIPNLFRSMAMDSYSLPLLWAALIFCCFILFLLSTFARIPNRRLLRHHVVSGLWRYPALVLLVSSSLLLEIPWGAMLNGLTLIFIVLANQVSETRYKAILAEELDGSPIKFPWLLPGKTASVPFFLCQYFLSIVAMGWITYLLYQRLQPLFRGTEENFIGGGILDIFVMNHLVFYTLSFSEYFRSVEPKDESPERRRERVTAFRDRRDWKSAGLLVGMFVLFVTFWFSPFTWDVAGRITFHKALQDSQFDKIDATQLVSPDGFSSLRLAVDSWPAYQDQNSCLSVSIPLGFALEEPGRLFCSELVFSQAQHQLGDRAKLVEEKVLPEYARLEPDRMQWIFMFPPKNDETAFKIVKNRLLEPGPPDESIFETEKTIVLDRLEKESTDPGLVASKFALLAHRQAIDFGQKKIAFFDDVKNITWKNFRNYFEERFSQIHQPLICETVSNPAAQYEMEKARKFLEPLQIKAIRRNRVPSGERRGEFRAEWNLAYPCVAASWQVPDPITSPTEHAGIVFGADTLEHRVVKPASLLALRSGSYLAPEGLIVYVSTVWKEDSKPDEILKRFFDLIDGQDWNATTWKATEDQLKHFSCRVLPHWIGPRNSPFAQEWSEGEYRYGNLFRTQEERRTLARDFRWLSLQATRYAMKKHLDRQRAHIVVLTPEKE